MNRNDMKEWFRVFKQAQQDEFAGKKSTKQSRTLNETRDVTIQEIEDAAYELQTNDPSRIATYLGAHEDEVALLMQDDVDATPPVGGGLGRGLELAKQNLKNALEVIYQEVTDALTDEHEGLLPNNTMEMAAEQTAEEVAIVVRDFYEGIGMLGYSRYDSFKH